MTNRSDLEHALGRILGPAGPEVGCDECFDELDRFVELELAHLEGCPACREEHESLRALVAGEPAP